MPLSFRTRTTSGSHKYHKNFYPGHNLPCVRHLSKTGPIYSHRVFRQLIIEDMVQFGLANMASFSFFPFALVHIAATTSIHLAYNRQDHSMSPMESSAWFIHFNPCNKKLAQFPTPQSLFYFRHKNSSLK